MEMKIPLVGGHRRAWGGGCGRPRPGGPSGFQPLATVGEQAQHQDPGPRARAGGPQSGSGVSEQPSLHSVKK